MAKIRWWGVVILWAVIFVGLRGYRLEERINFSMDQGMSMSRAKEIWDNRELTLLGPPASPTVEGKHFFHGPLTYYLLAGLGRIGGWEPINIAREWIILSVVSAGFLYLAVKKVWGSAKQTGKAAGIAIWMWTLLPPAIEYSFLIWNPSLLMLIVPVIMWGWSEVREKPTKMNVLGWGWLLGLAMQCHFQAMLLAGLGGMWMIKNGARRKMMGWWIAGLGMGYAPLIIFEVRNNFYNLKTISEWIMRGGSSNFEWQWFYFVEWLPIAVVLVARLAEKKKLAVVSMLAVIGVWAVVTATTGKGNGMPKDWNYGDLKKVAEILQGRINNEEKFNVVNLLSGDTRFYPLRYLLEIEGIKSMPIDKYKESKRVYVTAYKTEEVNEKRVWELGGKNKIRESWEINSKVRLYEME